MGLGLLGRKVGMTQVYDDQGNMLPVTVIEAGPCVILQLRTKERDGYEGVQLGFADKPRRLATRAERGHVASLNGKRVKEQAARGVTTPKAECEPQRFVREFRVDGAMPDVKVGDKLTVALFSDVAAVDVVGTTKGRGTAGVMKRYGFGGLRASHGVQRKHRAAGSIAGHATNRGFCGRIKKGKRMMGRYGNERSTMRNLRLVRVDEATNCLLVRGAVPGPNGGYVLIRQTNKLG